MSVTLSEATQKLIKARMQQSGYGSADELVRDAIEFFQGAELDKDDIAAIEESERQIAAGEDLDWKEVSAALRKQYLAE